MKINNILTANTKRSTQQTRKKQETRWSSVQQLPTAMAAAAAAMAMATAAATCDGGGGSDCDGNSDSGFLGTCAPSPPLSLLAFYLPLSSHALSISLISSLVAISKSQQLKKKYI